MGREEYRPPATPGVVMLILGGALIAVGHAIRVVDRQIAGCADDWTLED